SAKVVILFALSYFGDKQFIYKSLEWYGGCAENLSFDQSSTIANMGVEMGAKCVFLPPWKNSPHNMKKIIPENENKIVELNIEGLLPYIAAPHSPFNSSVITEHSGEKIDYVFVGSCANSRLDDLAEIAAVLKDNR